MTDLEIDNIIGKYVTLTYKTPFYVNGMKYHSTYAAYSDGKLNQGEYSDLRDHKGRIEAVCRKSKEDVLINEHWVNIRNRDIVICK